MRKVCCNAFTRKLHVSSKSLKYVGEMVQNNGYPFDYHRVATEDGYLLTVHRIPSGQSSKNQNRPIAFLQHGLLSSSADWIVSGPGRALAYLLADAGFDVWMGNARGNTHSRNHLTKSPMKPEFWDFSWHEIGIYDLPAMINYVIAWTRQPQIHYIGYSQGTTAFLVMTSLRTEFNDKIKCAQMMAPVAFMSNLSSPLIRAVAPFVNQLEWVLDKLNVHEYLPNANAKGKQNKSTLLNNSVFQDIVANALFMTGGFNSAQLDKRIIPQILQNTPAGASAKQVIHYGQGFNSGKFRQFDYGFVKNLDKYGSTSPPDYPIKDNIKCPIVLHYSENDWLSAVQDVEKLANELTSLKGILKVPDNKFNHYDYVWGRHANSLLYDKVIQLMEGY